MIEKSPSPVETLNPRKKKTERLNKSFHQRASKKDLWMLKLVREKKLAEFKAKLKKNQGAVYQAQLQKMKNARFLTRPYLKERLSRKYETVNKSYILRQSRDTMQKSPSNLKNRSLSPQPSNPSIEWAPIDDERRQKLSMLFHKRSMQAKLPEING